MKPSARVVQSLWYILPLFVLAGLLWPIGYATWISFTPSELLVPPKAEWSLRWYRSFFSQSLWVDALRQSLLVGVLACLISMVLGGTAAMAVARSRFRGRSWLRLGVLLPLFMPAVILGMTLLPAMHTLHLWGSTLSLALAHSLWGMPLVFLTVSDALQDADPLLESAARGLGATRWQTLRWVILPIISPALAVGGIMAFIVSLNELVMALFLCTPAIETLPKVIWPNLRYTLSPLVAAASGVSMLMTMLLLGCALWLRNAARR